MVPRPIGDRAGFLPGSSEGGGLSPHAPGMSLGSNMVPEPICAQLNV